MALMRKLSDFAEKTDECEMQSIVDNLNHILGTVRGYGCVLQDFGISDYKYLSTRQDIVEAVMAEIVENIKNHEPRIVLKKIEDMQNDKLSRLSFRIDFVVREKPHTVKLFLEPASSRFRIGS